jgi:hypothetical protein
LQQSLSDVVRRIFSSEVRRLELEKSFGNLSKPSPAIVDLLSNDGFAINLATPIHHPESSYVDRKVVAETTRLKQLEHNWNTPPSKHRHRLSNNNNRPQTAPQNNEYDLPVLSPSFKGFKNDGGSPLPRRTPPPYYPDDSQTRCGLPDFDEGVSRSLSYWDNSRKHYIAGLTGNTAKAGVKKFWGSASDTKKKSGGGSGTNNRRRRNGSGQKKHPLQQHGNSGGREGREGRHREGRWYHQQFAKHYKKIGLNGEPGPGIVNASHAGVATMDNVNGGEQGGEVLTTLQGGPRSVQERPTSSSSAPAGGKIRRSSLKKRVVVPTAVVVGTEASGMLSGWEDAK